MFSIGDRVRCIKKYYNVQVGETGLMLDMTMSAQSMEYGGMKETKSVMI